MPENSLTLLELNQQIKNSIERNFDAPVWVVAEINSINKHRSGHCYLEFIQKSNDYDQIIAKTRATIWSTQYRMIESYFTSVTGSNLQAGIKVMVKVSVDYHELYGLSLNVRDIEPAYTLGDLEKRKREIIERLEKEGVFDMNKELDLPFAIQNIAVISSSGAAGYEDFNHQLESNKYGYQFKITLFEAIMQGNQTESSVVEALSKIFDSEINFDVIAILRGGGSKSDLSFFDNYNIAYHITQIPIPVITGIGHDRDESVSDMVANTMVKTPTAVANFIIEHNLLFESELIELGDLIISNIKDTIETHEIYLTNLSLGIHRTKKIISDKYESCNKLFYRLTNLSKNRININKTIFNDFENRITNIPKVHLRAHEASLERMHERIISESQYRILNAKQKLEMYEQNIRLVDPNNVLRRGFSITRHKGKVITKNSLLKEGDIIETLIDGKRLQSSVKNKSSKNEKE